MKALYFALAYFVLVNLPVRGESNYDYSYYPVPPPYSEIQGESGYVDYPYYSPPYGYDYYDYYGYGGYYGAYGAVGVRGGY